ncbi:hypothetical protein X975_26613, partial [Stegodyphus mimosarum]
MKTNVMWQNHRSPNHQVNTMVPSKEKLTLQQNYLPRHLHHHLLLCC